MSAQTGTQQTYFEDVAVGQEIELKIVPTTQQLVQWAAGSGDFNPLHHDFNFPQSKQIGSVIVHGRFKYAGLGELVSNWLGHAGRIRKISCQYRGMDTPDKGQLVAYLRAKYVAETSPGTEFAIIGLAGSSCPAVGVASVAILLIG